MKKFHHISNVTYQKLEIGDGRCNGGIAGFVLSSSAETVYNYSQDIINGRDSFSKNIFLGPLHQLYFPNGNSKLFAKAVIHCLSELNYSLVDGSFIRRPLKNKGIRWSNTEEKYRL